MVATDADNVWQTWIGHNDKDGKAHTKKPVHSTQTVAATISISLENLWIIFSIEFGWIHTTKT